MSHQNKPRAKCACGLPLHYTDMEIYRQVQRMIDLVGDPFVLVTGKIDGKWRSWRVQRHYIALHKLKFAELPELASKLGFEEVPSEGRQMDHIGLFKTGVVVDIGWGTAVLNENGTLTRTCKGCGASATSPIDETTHKVREAAIIHSKSCPITFGNNAILS